MPGDNRCCYLLLGCVAVATRERKKNVLVPGCVAFAVLSEELCLQTRPTTCQSVG